MLFSSNAPSRNQDQDYMAIKKELAKCDIRLLMALDSYHNTLSLNMVPHEPEAALSRGIDTRQVLARNELEKLRKEQVELIKALRLRETQH